jgi:uncharacterized protein (DUF433 family)
VAARAVSCAITRGDLENRGQVPISNSRGEIGYPSPTEIRIGAKLEAMKPSSVVHSDPEILGGTPVFVGTRVPVQALIDYIEGGHTLEKFLDDFPSVPKELAIAALEQAKQHLIADARAA